MIGVERREVEGWWLKKNGGALKEDEPLYHPSGIAGPYWPKGRCRFCTRSFRTCQLLKAGAHETSQQASTHDLTMRDHITLLSPQHPITPSNFTRTLGAGIPRSANPDLKMYRSLREKGTSRDNIHGKGALMVLENANKTPVCILLSHVTLK
ncbi:uncharacterized protein BKA78DRAFT_187532 [Phyllosticta capitalensis]|uniref:uncharacterized protein n=1 Tax=Phyllosticta capitalensis TaxID=121624 RepID=UPI00312E4428